MVNEQRDIELIAGLLPLWHATRSWAETLLCRSLHLAHASQILEPAHRGRKRIPGTLWFYRTHGLGVDIYKGYGCGGIDFDFEQALPDAWRLHLFATRQLNDGSLASDDFWMLVDDEARFTRVAEHVLETFVGATR